MTSYLVYVVVAMRNFTSLSSEGDRGQVPIWKHYSQLTLKESLHHFRRVNDSFFDSYLCIFDRGLEKNGVSNESWEVVNQYGCMFLQFPTFTYLRIRCYDEQPFMLPRYPYDKNVLVELTRQMVVVHEKQSGSHRIGFKFLLSIRRYSINSIFKERAMEDEMRSDNETIQV